MNKDVYGEALADMGSEPLEYGEPVGGWGGHRLGAGRKPLGQGPRAKVSITLDVALLAKLDNYIATNGGNRSAMISELLARELAE